MQQAPAGNRGCAGTRAELPPHERPCTAPTQPHLHNSKGSSQVSGSCCNQEPFRPCNMCTWPISCWRGTNARSTKHRAEQQVTGPRMLGCTAPEPDGTGMRRHSQKGHGWQAACLSQPSEKSAGCASGPHCALRLLGVAQAVCAARSPSPAAQCVTLSKAV